MVKKVAVFGAGRMGSVVAGQLPSDVEKLVIDNHAEAAEKLAASIGGKGTADPHAAADADVVALVLPAPVVSIVAKELGPILKPGAIVLNMATKGTIEEETKASYPQIHYVDAKIIGHADSMKLGAPCFVVVKTEDDAILEAAQYVLQGYRKVVKGNADLVPLISSIGSTEGIRAAIRCRQLLKEYDIPKEWEDIVIYTVCAGTARAYVEDNMGEFAKALAEKLEKEVEAELSGGKD